METCVVCSCPMSDGSVGTCVLCEVQLMDLEVELDRRMRLSMAKEAE